MTSENDVPVLACNIHAIPQEQRPVYQASVERLFGSAREVRELENGYAWHLPDDRDILYTVATFLSYERLCCPFFRFSLEIEPEQGPIWLSITGSREIKQFLREEGLAV